MGKLLWFLIGVALGGMGAYIYIAVTGKMK
jgi:hypothetical protein